MTQEQLRIFNLIPAESKVLDVGCGDGTMLNLLAKSKKVTPLGLEIDIERVKECVRQKVPVLQMNIDNGMSSFRDDQFDVAILKFTISEVRHPAEVFREIMRVAKECIIVISNFAYWKVRWSLLVDGRMPVTEELPYEWYDTPNIHWLSIEDMERFFESEGTEVLHKTYFATNTLEKILTKIGLQNLTANTALFHLRRKD